MRLSGLVLFVVFFAILFASCSGSEVESTSDALCTEGDSRCNETAVMRCLHGAWEFEADCSYDEQVCLNGRCIDGDDNTDGDVTDGDVIDGDSDESEQDGDVTDGDTDGDTTDGDTDECECDEEDGLLCDSDSGECKPVSCSPCVTDEDCALTEKCFEDRSADYKICLGLGPDCPFGYYADPNGYCHPSIGCPLLAGIGDPCRHEESPDEAECEPELACVVEYGYVPYCTFRCEPYVEGECDALGEEAYCATFSNQVEGYWCARD